MPADDFDPRLPAIMERLLKVTREGGAEWLTTGRGDQLMYSAFNSSVIVESQDEDGLAPYIIRILNSDGRVVTAMTCGAADEHIALARELFNAATRQSLKVDETLDSLLRNLDEPPF